MRAASVIIGDLSFFAREASHWRMNLATGALNRADLSHAGRCKLDVTLDYVLVKKGLYRHCQVGSAVAENIPGRTFATANPSVGGLDQERIFILWLKF